MTKRRLVACAMLLALASVLFAQANFPNKPIEVVVGFAAGGGTHLAAELLTPEATKFLGQPIRVTTKPGAGGAIGATAVATARADGYTLLYATMSLPISLYMDSVDFRKNDFIGLALASNVAPVMAVRADAPYNNARELKAWIQANPGQFSWAHPGVGSTLHVLGANMLYAMAVTKQVKEVPFRGTNEGISAVLGGHVSAVSSFPATLLEQVRAGTMKIIGVSSPTRIEELPAAPTFIEQGFNAILTSTRGVFIRSGTPRSVIDYLDKGLEKIITSEDFQKRAIALGEPAVYANSAEFNRMYQEQCVMIEALLKELGLID
jgi:tripartite-type tricarboxylate transporter receptor subunit TctC